MEITGRPGVLDKGTDAKRHLRACGSATAQDGINIAYEVYALDGSAVQISASQPSSSSSSPTGKVIMIMGFAAGGDAWLPMVKDLFARGNKVTSDVEVAVFDNRGIGRSSTPSPKSAYTTTIMAEDALAVMDALGWREAHVVGHSMGAMIAARLALVAPQRVASLALVSATGGGMEAIPTNLSAIAAGLRGAVRTDALSRASVDLAFHFSPKLLQRKDPDTERTVKELLKEEYVASKQEGGGQMRAGQDGHMNAVMTHHISKPELQRLRGAGIPIVVIHGADDILAAPRHAARLARRLAAPLVLLDGAHFVPRDCAAEVNDELLAVLESTRHGAPGHYSAVRPYQACAHLERRGLCATLFCCCLP